MKKLIIILLSIVAIEVSAQDSTMIYTEEGLVTGFNRMGLDADRTLQPIYGITFQQQFGRLFNAEATVIYTQAEANNIMRDYLSFCLIGKPGYYGHKAGVYGVYGFSINPALGHSNPENHTYGALLIGAGAQLNIAKKKVIDLKLIYSAALSGAYLKNGEWSEYSGLQLMLTFKIKR